MLKTNPGLWKKAEISLFLLTEHQHGQEGSGFQFPENTLHNLDDVLTWNKLALGFLIVNVVQLIQDKI